MANIMINQVCNLSCPYCFANEYVNSRETCLNHSQNISVENFRTALNFISRTLDRVGIIGGEPTLHPKFVELLKIVLETKAIHFATLFTNAVEIDSYLDIISGQKFSYLINVNSPSNMGKGPYNKMIKNLDTMHFERYLGDRTNLGINMYNPNFEYDYMLELLKRYNKDQVRVSICVPNSDELRDLHPLEYFNKMKPRVFEFFMALRENNIMPHFDCNGLPKCMINENESEFLTSFYDLEKSSGGYCNLVDGNFCTPVIDIMPDLSTARCFGVSPTKKTYINDYADLNELSASYIKDYDFISQAIPIGDACDSCKEFRTNKCHGGCLSFKLSQINKVRNISNNIYLDSRL